MDHSQSRKNLLKSIGPGILLAGAAIGGSHLLASTTAGAQYGFSLLWIVLIINLLKYPFFEYGQRYTAATGETILDGYQRLGRWEIVIFFLLNLFTAVANIAGVSLIAGILAGELFGTASHPFLWTAVVLAICMLLILIGRYKWLDRTMKIQVSLLALATIIALAAAIYYNKGFVLPAAAPSVWNRTGILFLIALMGWMPAPIELSAWASLWMQERKLETGHAATVREARIDFNIGYIAAALLAVVFLSLGALVMFGSGETLQGGGRLCPAVCRTLHPGARQLDSPGCRIGRFHHHVQHNGYLHRRLSARTGGFPAADGSGLARKIQTDLFRSNRNHHPALSGGCRPVCEKSEEHA
jgi:Mn2+/Fe2+ NRAMP family transporter